MDYVCYPPDGCKADSICRRGMGGGEGDERTEEEEVVGNVCCGKVEAGLHGRSHG